MPTAIPTMLNMMRDGAPLLLSQDFSRKNILLCANSFGRAAGYRMVRTITVEHPANIRPFCYRFEILALCFYFRRFCGSLCPGFRFPCSPAGANPFGGSCFGRYGAHAGYPWMRPPSCGRRYEHRHACLRPILWSPAALWRLLLNFFLYSN